jgi:hypothetical protein
VEDLAQRRIGDLDRDEAPISINVGGDVGDDQGEEEPAPFIEFKTEHSSIDPGKDSADCANSRITGL